MNQSKKHSALEAVTNVIAGYGVNFLANIIIFPFYGWELSVSANMQIGVWYTLISLIRSYTLRRIYNRLHK